MKNPSIVFKGVFLTICLFTLIFGCGGPSGSGPTSGTIDNGVVKFNFDGANWVSGPPGHPEMKFEEEAITDGNTMVRVEAYAEDGSHLALTIFKESGGIDVGTYPVADKGMQGFYQPGSDGADGFLTGGMDSNPGTITIASLSDEKVTGTFSFPVRNSGDPDDVRQITNGSFDVKFVRY